MLPKFLVATAMLGAASPAYAHDWWVLKTNNATCVSAEQFSAEIGTPVPSTPENIANYERSQGSIVTPKEYRDSSGNLWAVQLAITLSTGATGYMNFFVSDERCESFLKTGESLGEIANPNDLN